MTPEQEAEVRRFVTASRAMGWAPWATAAGESPQADFLRGAADRRTRVYRAGNRNGKTEVGAYDVVLHAAGLHPWARFRGGQHWWVSGLDWEFGVGQVLWPKIRKFLDAIPWEVRSVSFHRRTDPELPNVVRFRSGGSITFKSADSGARKYQGAALHGLWVDEEHPADVVEEGRTRLIDRGGYFTATLTPVRRARWVQDVEREPGTLVVRSSLRQVAEAGIVDPEEVARLIARLPDRQRRVRVDGDHVALEGLVYPDFQRDDHTARPVGGRLVTRAGVDVAPWPLPPTWRRWAAVDWGYANPASVGVYAEDPHTGRAIVERCYHVAGVRASVWGPFLERELPPLQIPLVSDHQAQERAEVEAAGVPTLTARKEVVEGIEEVERWVTRRLPDGAPALVLYVDEDAPPATKLTGRCDAEALAWEIEAYHYPPRKETATTDPKDLPVKKDDHAVDQLRYALMARAWDWGGRGGPIEQRGPVVDRGYDPSVTPPVAVW